MEIYFSGWIEDTAIKPYEDYKEKYSSKCNTSAFNKAMKKIEEFIVNKRVRNFFLITG